MPDFDNSTSAKTDSSEKISVVSYNQKTTDEWNNLFSNGYDIELQFVGALHVLNIDIDKFKELSIEEETSLINKSFRSLSLKWHPDKNSSAEAPETFKVLSNAQDFLLKSIRENYIPDNFDSAKDKLNNFLTGSPRKSDVQENQEDVPLPHQKKSYANFNVRKPYHEQEETTPEQEALGEELRRQLEAMRNATKQNNNSHPSQSTTDYSVLLNEDELQEKLKQSIEVAQQILDSKESSLSNKNAAFGWLINAKLADTPNDISDNLAVFDSLNLISMLPVSQKSSVPDEPTMGVNPEDKRYQVLSALMKEQRRLMNQYHLVDGKEEVKDGIRLTTEIGLRSNGKPYYKEDSKVAKTARERVQAIGELAKKLDQSLREHPAGDAKFTDKKIHVDLIGLRSKMHGTSLLKGSFVTGRSNITQAMQIVAPKPPKNQPKPGLIENVKRRLGFSK